MAAKEYSIWQALEWVIRLALRSNEEVRLLAASSPNAKAVRAMVDEAISEQKGSGIEDAFISRDGDLILLLGGGRTKNLGRVVGKDVDMHVLGEQIADAVMKLPKPRDGMDGLGFDDFSINYDGERTFTLRFDNGERSKEIAVKMPVLLDRGVWERRRYEKGDVVTYAGSMFIAQADTDQKPEEGRDWRLGVKRGYSSKEAEYWLKNHDLFPYNDKTQAESQAPETSLPLPSKTDDV